MKSLTACKVTAEAEPALAVLHELLAMLQRACLLPAVDFRDRVVDVAKDAAKALKHVTIDGDDCAASGARVRTIRFELGEGFLDRVAALRAFEREHFDTGHGASRDGD